MTMRLVQVGVDLKTGQPKVAYVHPFLAGARKNETRVPDTHTTKSGKELPAFRVIDFGAFKPVQKEKYNRVKHR